MRRGVSIQNSILVMVFCVVLSACGTTNGGGNNSGGGGNGGSGSGGGTQIQAGQWEFVVAPNDGSAVFYVEANLTPSAETVFAAVANTGIYQQQ
jgi:predicted small secreted protein